MSTTTPDRGVSTADEALEKLIEGNRRFVNGEAPDMPMTPARRDELTGGQAPMATIVSCSDSRVPPELLFGRGLGELFIIRNAGNTIDTAALGSIQYGAGPLGIPLIVVMGHQRCGAVGAAADIAKKNATFPGVIGRMVEPIVPAVLCCDGDGEALVESAVRENVRRQVRSLREATDGILADPQSSGSLKVVGAYYSFDTGEVDFFDRP